MVGALVLLVVVDRGTDQIVIHWHNPTAGLVHAGLVLVLATLVLSAVPVGMISAVGGALARRTRAGAGAGVDAGADASAVAGADASADAGAGRGRTARRRGRRARTQARGRGRGGRGHGEPRARPSMTRRRQLVEGVGGTLVFGATGSMLGWGMARGRHSFELDEVPLRIPGLPRSLDGYVIAQVSDLHTGAFVGERELDEGLSLVRRARPDLVVVTGDLVDFDPAFAPLAARKLADLSARDGVTAVLGNHDYYAGADGVVAALQAAGIDLMRNVGRVVRPGDGGGFALLGVDDVSSRRHGGAGPRLDLAKAAVRPDLPRILLSHQPVTVDLWPGEVAVQLSGHTHGGQINPGFSPLGLLMKYVAGFYEVGGTTLYVNRGFGTVGAPSRIGAPPEITRFVLVAA